MGVTLFVSRGVVCLSQGGKSGFGILGFSWDFRDPILLKIPIFFSRLPIVLKMRIVSPSSLPFIHEAMMILILLQVENFLAIII